MDLINKYFLTKMRGTFVLFLNFLLSLGLVSLFACNPRDVDVTNGAMECFQNSKGQTKCKPKNSSTSSASGDTSPLNKTSLIDDFSLAAHGLERTAEVASLIKLAFDQQKIKPSNSKIIQSYKVEPISSSPTQSAVKITTHKESNESERASKNGQVNWDGVWNIELGMTSEGQFQQALASAEKFQWSGVKNDLQMNVFEFKKSFTLQKNGTNQIYSFHYISPVSTTISRGTDSDASYFLIELFGFTSMDLSSSTLVFQNLNAKIIFPNLGKELNIESRDDLKIELLPCLKISGRAQMNRQDKNGKNQVIPIEFLGTSLRVNGKEGDPKKGWKYEYANCAQPISDLSIETDRPLLDFFRLIKSAKPNN